MIKQVLILAYIVTVLVISSLVRADAAPGIISAVQINPATGVMIVHGSLPTPCQQDPTVVVTNIDRVQNVVKFVVVTTNNGRACPDVVYGSFDIAFDLKDLSLEKNKTYTFVFSNFVGQQAAIHYTAIPTDANFSDYKTRKETVSGLLLFHTSTGFVLQDGHRLIDVVSPDMDLTRFQNDQVWISGYAVSTALLEGSTMNDGLAPSSPIANIVVPVSVSTLEP